MEKTKQYLAGWNTSAPSKWADHVEIMENPKRKGIELLFNNEPSHELQSKLRASGFRPSKVKNMWYSDNNPDTKSFALDVESTIASSITGPDLVLSPSFEATRTNIEKKEFSFILITLKDGQIKNYIIFEPSKPKAEVIAIQFSREQFGDNFSALAAKSRAQVREARMLFDEGKIIFPISKEEVSKKPISLSPSSLHQENNVPIASIHSPEEEEIIRQFKAKGFPSSFTAQEAFDKNLPVIDLAFRYAPAMEYFREHIEAPLQKQIQKLQQELKDLGKTKDLIEKRNALKDRINNLQTEIVFAEKLIDDENIIFQEDLFNIILEKARQKGHSQSISKDLNGFRDYILMNILDNRAIENYPKDPVQKVVAELLGEYAGSKNIITKTKPNLSFIHPASEKNQGAILPKEINDPLANEHGIYTEEKAGQNFERVIIPMPKSARYEAEIEIAKRSDGNFVLGMNGSKKFGDYSGFSYAPGLAHSSYESRSEALKAGLKEHVDRLEQLLLVKDNILNNEEKKNKQLTSALEAIKDFAKANSLPIFSQSPIPSNPPQPIEKQSSPIKKKLSQYELNKEIEALIDRKDLSKESFNQEEKNQIRQYSGSGGLIRQGATGKGVLYEYYTPDTIIRKMWDMAYHYGYDGGSVLEPSVGIGSFLKYAPKGADLVGYEVNHYAARIVQILYPTAQIHEAAFETIFFAGNVHLKDEYSDTRYSLIIGNPPYGDFSGRYAGMGEKKWTGAFKYEQYFTLRGLDLLKSGGLLIYIIPSNFPNSFGDAIRIASKCTGLDRYYLGTGIFKTTDIETDIIALRKN